MPRSKSNSKSSSGSDDTSSSEEKDTKRNRKRSVSSNKSKSKSKSKSEQKQKPPCEVIVRNLTKTITKNHLMEIFGNYGKIKNIDFPFDEKLKIHKGYCTIEYETHPEAEEAITYLNQGQIDGNYITCEFVTVAAVAPLNDKIQDVKDIKKSVKKAESPISSHKNRKYSPKRRSSLPTRRIPSSSNQSKTYSSNRNRPSSPRPYKKNDSGTSYRHGGDRRSKSRSRSHSKQRRENSRERRVARKGGVRPGQKREASKNKSSSESRSSSSSRSSSGSSSSSRSPS